MKMDIFSGLAPLVGKRATKAIFRTIVYWMCLTLIFSGVISPCLGMAQVLAPVSLKEVPVPVPTAAVIPVVTPGVNPIPGPGTDLVFRDLIAARIVKDQNALIRLGKALFWDMQVGSDGIQACASCHFNAGADSRSKNQISPGVKDANFLHGFIGGDNHFGNSVVPFTAHDINFPFPGSTEPPDPNFNVPGHPQFAPNYELTAADFPLNDWFVPTNLVPRGNPGPPPVLVSLFQELEGVSRDTNDVVSSQGVRNTQFVAVQPGNAEDLGTPLPDIFNTVKPGNPRTKPRVRRVEPRNAPTVINAVFNFDNFWDGRASFIFNGVNPFGFRDEASTLIRNDGTAQAPVGTQVFVRITNSSLASQAVGPPGSNFEMSWAGRTFPDIGKKMLSLRPLAKQLVHPKDSVLGLVSQATVLKGKVVGKPGLKYATYTKWWNDTTSVLTPVAGSAVVQKASVNDPRTMVLSPGKAAVVKGKAAGAGLAANEYTQMMWNFSLFFGLAVQAYEATLVSDNTPFDRFNGAPSLNIPADPTALTEQELLGLTIFQDADPVNGAKCVNCHVPPVTSSHTVLDNAPDAQGVPGGGQGEAIETMIMGDNLETANYDHGMYNIGVRRTTEDAGRAGTAPFTNPLINEPFPLSLVELAALRANVTRCPSVPGINTGCLPDDVARFVPDVPVLPRRVSNGAFKVPTLRNTLYTGPYFHNGDSATLIQAVQFYIRGGNFPNTNLHDKTVDIDGIPPLMFPEFDPFVAIRVEALVAFLANALTDQRVALEKGPFDHPQLFVPNGSPAGQPAVDAMLEIPPIGKCGRTAPIPTFLNLKPMDGK